MRENIVWSISGTYYTNVQAAWHSAPSECGSNVEITDTNMSWQMGWWATETKEFCAEIASQSAKVLCKSQLARIHFYNPFCYLGYCDQKNIRFCNGRWLYDESITAELSLLLLVIISFFPVIMHHNQVPLEHWATHKLSATNKAGKVFDACVNFTDMSMKTGLLTEWRATTAANILTRPSLKHTPKGTINSLLIFDAETSRKSGRV